MADRIAAGTTVRVVSGLVKGLEGKFITQNRGSVTATMRGNVIPLADGSLCRPGRKENAVSTD